MTLTNTGGTTLLFRGGPACLGMAPGLDVHRLQLLGTSSECHELSCAGLRGRRRRAPDQLVHLNGPSRSVQRCARRHLCLPRGRCGEVGPEVAAVSFAGFLRFAVEVSVGVMPCERSPESPSPGSPADRPHSQWTLPRSVCDLGSTTEPSGGGREPRAGDSKRSLSMSPTSWVKLA